MGGSKSFMADQVRCALLKDTTAGTLAKAAEDSLFGPEIFSFYLWKTFCRQNIFG